MDDLEDNPLYRAFLTKFRREFEIACKMSYIIAIPQTDSLDHLVIDQFLANSHILMPSKLLKMHYTPLQKGYSEDIEIEGNRLVVYFNKKKPVNQIKVNILAEEIGYNIYNKEYRTILIDRPLMALNERPLLGAFRLQLQSSSPNLSRTSSKPPKPLRDHDDCSKYLEFISQETTVELELDVKRIQSNYLILSEYLDDAALRIESLVENYIPKYELKIETTNRDNTGVCPGVKQAIRLAVENYVVHLLHGKLLATIFNLHKQDDRKLMDKFNEISRSKMTICMLGAQSAFADFTLTEEIVHELRSLSSRQSPLAIVSSLIRLVKQISEQLNQSVKLKNLMGDGPCKGDKVSICSDDLIASFVYSLAQARPSHLYSMCKYLEMFGWSSNANNEAAYNTATFQIAMQYVFNR